MHGMVDIEFTNLQGTGYSAMGQFLKSSQANFNNFKYFPTIHPIPTHQFPLLK